MSDWYYSTGGQAFGPVSEDTLRNKLSNSELSREDLVWNVGAKNWERVDRIPSFSTLINTPPPLPVTPLPPPLPYTSKVPANYAWRRYIAMLIDLEVAWVIAIPPLVFIAPESQATIFFLGWILTLIAWGVMNAALKCRTLGRAVLGIRVDKLRADASYGDRTVRVAFSGLWLGIPILSLIPCFIAYKKYRETGTTFWDKGDFHVKFSPNAAGPCVAGITVILALGIAQQIGMKILILAMYG